jgi:2,4-dienoyl-CoA reductase-like NADH-dependent reductase (Old Yellow Enzyme family)
MRLACEVASAVRKAWPQDKPLLARISATDWMEGGWSLPDSIELSQKLKALGVDMIDCSSGGLVPHAKVPVGPGYQTRFAEAVRSGAGIPTAAVGMITEPVQAEHILRSGQADAVLLARQLLREPYWPLRAARVLGATVKWPEQYERARD